eukprot:352048-Chlamydomonas_euryale.AAC.2
MQLPSQPPPGWSLHPFHERRRSEAPSPSLLAAPQEQRHRAEKHLYICAAMRPPCQNHVGRRQPGVRLG